MNSSGIKRGLAATAVAALAVTGLPFLASSASAAPGDGLSFVSAGPALNGGAEGAVVRLRVESGTITPANLKLKGTDLSSSEDNASQDVAIVGVPVVIPNAGVGDSNPTDGKAEVIARIAVTTTPVGATANFAVYEDDDADSLVDAGEARTTAAVSTAGAPASITIAPGSQTAPAGVDSGDYTLTLKDSAGRTTQLTGAQNIDLNTSPGGVSFSDGEFDVVDLALGTTTFTAQAGAPGLYTITAAGDVDTDGAGADVADGPAGVSGTATLDVVVAAAGITAAETDIVTGADTWVGFGGGNFGAPDTQVRQDQSSVKVDVKSPSNAGKTLSLTATGTGVTFGGAGTSTKTVTLDASGVGSVTFAVDASSITVGDSIALAGGGIAENLVYTAPAFSASTVNPDAATYLSSFGGTVSPVVTVTDQYGNPAAGTYVTVQRTGGANADSESARKQVGADGKVSFSLTDTKATAASHATDTLTFRLYAGQFDAAPLATDNSSTIVYSATGQGADFQLTVDAVSPTGSAYNPANLFANPLTDTAANNAGDSIDESIALGINGGTTGTPVSVTVDGGALLLKNAETRLSQASATDTGVIGTDTFKIVGTKAGLVTITVVSGGVTKTGQVTIHSLGQDLATAATAPVTARNLSVTGPEKAEAGDVVTFTVNVTDAFGNAVPNVAAASFNTLVTGSGQVTGNSGSTDASGNITFQVKVDESADSPVGLQVTGTGADFGAAVNRLTAASTTDDGTGLTKSENIDTATIAKVVNIEALQAAVDAAQAKVDAATDNLDAAKGTLAVAKAERSVARTEVRQAKRDLRQAKRQHHGVKAARKALRQARGDLTIANAKVSAAQATVNRAMERLAAAQAELEAAQQALADAQA